MLTPDTCHKARLARDAWREIEPSLARIAGIVTGTPPLTTRTEADHAASA